MDVENGHRIAVFTAEGRYARTFHFGSPQPASPPYATVCNGDRVFAHYGWEQRPDMTGRAYRSSVPHWVSGPDSGVRQLLGEFPGSERHGHVVDGQFRGSRPLPLGKEPVIAIGRNRVYIGSADRYEVTAYDFAARPVAKITKPNVTVQATTADIDYSIDQETAGRADSVRRRIAGAYARLALPKTLPPYAALIVDSEDLVWVQDYPRAEYPSVRWSVFDASGRAIAEVAVSTHLEVYEIGVDYVLGRYLDPDDAVPQVRLYRLRRNAQ